MKSSRQIAVVVICVAASSSQIACVGSSEVDEEFAEVQEDVIAVNALTSNALTSNALTSNALTSNALTSNALTSNALTSNALTSNALQDPLAREALKFIVGCALAKGTHLEVDVDGVTYGFDGEIGLAPEWGNVGGHCNKECREWVSGCVLSRVNYMGEHVPISIRGRNRALESALSEQESYPRREAAYYGDIFTTPQRRFACLSPGQTEIPRVCGPSIAGCVVDVVGSCDDVCGRSQKDGSFPDCRADIDEDHASQSDSSIVPVYTELFQGSVTVFLKQ
jgi:hypothetical protein